MCTWAWVKNKQKHYMCRLVIAGALVNHAEEISKQLLSAGASNVKVITQNKTHIKSLLSVTLLQWWRCISEHQLALNHFQVHSFLLSDVSLSGYP